MKKQLFTLAFLLASFSIASAQYIHIEDGNLRQKLKTLFPQCVNAQLQLDTTCAAVVNAQELNLNYLNLYSIKEIKYFKSLKKLECAFNQLVKLPTEWPKNLETLSCSYNRLEVFPGNLPKNLKTIYISYNKLTTLPGVPYSTTELHCANNQLTSISVGNTQLRKLNCSNNKLTTLTLPFAVSEVDCSYNNLSAFPSSVFNNNTTLININCSNNQISDIENMPGSIKILTARNNRLYYEPWKWPSALEIVDLSGNQLTNLHFSTLNVIKLDCSNNLLDYISSPQSLIELKCNNNKLKTLSLNTKLQKLDCSNNQIDYIPLHSSLIELNCRNNAIVYLSPGGTNLQKLDCSHNKIQYLSLLPSTLKELYCNSNNVEYLFVPNALVKLNVAHNTSIHFESLTLPSTLTYFKASGITDSPLPTLPNSIQNLILDSMELTALPTLPTSLKQLSCIFNRLTSLPVLPASVNDVKAKLNCFPTPPTNPYPGIVFIVSPNRADCGAARIDETESSIEVVQPGLYPNPAIHEITINDPHQIITFEIWDGKGIKIMEAPVHNNKINVELLRAGIYTLKCTSENGYSIYSFVKE